MARVPGTSPAGIPADFVQGSAAATWNITHNLGRIPAITIYDTSNKVMEADVTATTTTATLVFASAKAGRAVIR